MSLKGKTVLITGSSRGIGKETAKLMAEKEANVIIQYHQNRKAAEFTFKELKPGDHILLQADLSDNESLKSLVDRVLDKYIKVDVLVNNAGIFDMLEFENADFDAWLEHWQKTISLNLSGPANLSFLIAKHMTGTGGGRIINISSRGAFRGEPVAMAYGASKAGLNVLGQSMAKALGEQGVFVYTIAPGFVETDMSKAALNSPMADVFLNESPLGRVARPGEVANMIRYCADEAPDFMTGCIIDINGASYLRT
ncbi:MAG: SDR family oxidoreductase [Bacteroidetes bacterium]|nr:SDR family oxidoreductase [Bacteroidota bacterium]